MASLWAEALFYGSYLVLFGVCICIYGYQRFSNRLLTVAVFMFVLATAHALVQFSQFLSTYEVVTESVCVGFTCSACYHGDETRARQLNIWNRLQPVSQALLVTNQLIADGLLIYRCYSVWQSKFRIIMLPLLMVAATAVSGYIQANILNQLYLIRRDTPLDQATPPPDWRHLQNLQSSLSETYMACSLATNIVVTTLIAARIWWKSHQVRTTLGPQAGRSRSAANLVIESGALFSASLLVWLIMHALLPNKYEYIAGAISSQMVGIVPTLIIVRVGLGKSIDKTARIIEVELHSPISPSRTSRSVRFSMYGPDSPDAERQDPPPVPVMKARHMSVSTIKLPEPPKVRDRSVYD
ncbi:hypothetical protein GLOTRDRAFT_135769 [Gloeophyllum trabeum ATCC 11539]|uniref:Uncharacterized protein n=1 Tax=Gloeophyllum trabeum (strain ATCC 11539 / FP-39264 / Madison 617) TaxID=670483 RepID=S7S1C8_GLOTA|nr:uncharacterized protein GLOTRDRAFT_135769 [Gloeophyllum trabeum ATCC 11539]EPQ61250.1 hypothetical protein GLOTRDRAFT_135769 [Gloeophyllum trabeum ATCC 11539]